MPEFKRVIRIPAVLLVFAVIFLVNIGLYLYQQFPGLNIAVQKEQTAVYHQLLREQSAAPLPDPTLIEQRRLEATAYGVLQNPDSFLYDHYKDIFPDIYALVSAGKTMANALYYENAYILLKGQLTYFEEFSGRGAKMEKEYAQKSNSILFRNQKNTLLNMEKTLHDFRATSHVVLTLGDDRAVTSLMDAPFTDFLLFAFLTFIGFCFISERSTGLWETVYATKKGRAYLNAQRVLCLWLFTFLAGTLLLLPKHLISFQLYDGYGQLIRNIQSIPRFSKCLIPISVKDFLLLYYGVKLLSSFFVALLIWAVLSSNANVHIAVFSAVLFLIAEYTLFNLPQSSFWVIAKYLNIFSYIQPAYLLASYHNVAFLGALRNMPELSVYLLFPMIALVTGAQIFGLSRKRPGNKTALGERLLSVLSRFISSITPHVPSFLRELQKKLILERWLLPLCVLVFLACAYQAPQGIMTPKDAYKQFYYQQFHAVDGERLAGRLKTEEERLAKQVAELGRTLNDATGYSQLGALTLLEQTINRQNALESIRQEAQEIHDANQSYKVKAVLSDPYLTEAILGSTGLDYRSGRALLILFFIVLQAGTLIPFERQENILPIVRATGGGAPRLWRKKRAVHLLLTLGTYLCLYVPEWAALLSQKYISLSAAIQSFPTFRSFPHPVSLLAYCLILYGYRLVITIGFSFVVIYFSSFIKNAFKSTLLLTSAIMLPMVMAVLLKQTGPYWPFFFFSVTWPIAAKTSWTLAVFPVLCALAAYAGDKRMRRLS